MTKLFFAFVLSFPLFTWAAINKRACRLKEKKAIEIEKITNKIAKAKSNIGPELEKMAKAQEAYGEAAAQCRE